MLDITMLIHSIVSIEFHLHKLLNLQRNTYRMEYSLSIRDLIIFAFSTKTTNRPIRIFDRNLLCKPNENGQQGGRFGRTCVLFGFSLDLLVFHSFISLKVGEICESLQGISQPQNTN